MGCIEAGGGALRCRCLSHPNFGNVSLAESPAMNKTVYEHAPDSRGAHDHDDLLKELWKTVLSSDARPGHFEITRGCLRPT